MKSSKHVLAALSSFILLALYAGQANGREFIFNTATKTYSSEEEMLREAQKVIDEINRGKLPEVRQNAALTCPSENFPKYKVLDAKTQGSLKIVNGKLQKAHGVSFRYILNCPTFSSGS